MQKKIYTGLLLIAVITIWGYVGYRFMGGMSSEEDEFLADEEISEEASPVKINTSQPLLLNYTDPFLKSEIKPAPIQTGGKPLQPIKKIDKPVVPVSTYSWPAIAFKGLIQNQNHPEKLLALVLVNGKERIVRKGEKVDELVVTNIDKHKVEFLHENEKREFRK